jgi:hypothetical protein
MMIIIYHRQRQRKGYAGWWRAEQTVPCPGYRTGRSCHSQAGDTVSALKLGLWGKNNDRVFACSSEPSGPHNPKERATQKVAQSEVLHR